MQVHPIALLMPPMSEEEYRQLVSSLKEQGLLEPIVLVMTQEGRQIIDGRHRYRACCELGIDPKWAYLEGTPDTRELLHYVLAANLHRRHLSESQRAMIAARIATLKLGDNQYTQEGAPRGAPSQSQAATLADVSRRLVQRADVVVERGTEALQESVANGDVPVNVAEKVARLPERQQVQFLWTLGETSSPPHQVLAKLNRERRRKEILARANNAPLNTGERSHVAAADPAWSYEQQLMGHTDRGVENHYPTMPLQDICALPVKEITHEDAVLFLWVPACLIVEGLKVVSAWGFEYKTHIVWDKITIGMGFHVRNQHELLFIARRGNLPLPEPEDTPPSVIRAPREGHSRKPAIFMEWIERMYPQYSKVELFARVRREGWDAWGYEAPTERGPGEIT